MQTQKINFLPPHLKSYKNCLNPQNNWHQFNFSSLYNDNHFTDKWLVCNSIVEVILSYFKIRQCLVNRLFIKTIGNSLQVCVEFAFVNDSKILLQFNKNNKFVNHLPINSSLAINENQLETLHMHDLFLLEKTLSRIIISSGSFIRFSAYPLDTLLSSQKFNSNLYKFTNFLFIYPTTQLFCFFVCNELQKTKSHNQYVQFLKKTIESFFFKQSLNSPKQRVLGVRFLVKGRLNNSDRKKVVRWSIGQVPTQTISAFIDYGFSQCETSSGLISFHLWVFWSR